MCVEMATERGCLTTPRDVAPGRAGPRRRRHSPSVRGAVVDEAADPVLARDEGAGLDAGDGLAHAALDAGEGLHGEGGTQPAAPCAPIERGSSGDGRRLTACYAADTSLSWPVAQS